MGSALGRFNGRGTARRPRRATKQRGGVSGTPHGSKLLGAAPLHPASTPPFASLARALCHFILFYARSPTSSRRRRTDASHPRADRPAPPQSLPRAGTTRNSVADGLRARSLTPVAALGETRAVLDAHLAAYRRELAAPGPYARDLAEAVACAQLRAARAEHLEAQLLARAAEETGDLAAPGTRAAWVLVLRYRREAELSAKCARQELEALARARAAGLLPGEDEAAAAEAELDATLAALSQPNEPSPRKAEPAQEVSVAPEPANDDAAPNEPEPADGGAAPDEPEPADDAGAPSEPEPAAPERTPPHLMTALACSRPAPNPGSTASATACAPASGPPSGSA